MPKTYNHLFDQIISIDNLYDAFHKAQRGRRKKPDVTQRVASFRGYACHADSYDTLRSVLGSIHLARHHST